MALLSGRNSNQFQSTLPARGATISGTPYKQTSDISIHAPRTGSDFQQVTFTIFFHLFQSTLPARGATGKGGASPQPSPISIHAPRTGSDGCIF